MEKLLDRVIPEWAKSVNCGITVCDAEGNIIYMNDKARDIFKSHGDMVGKNLMPCHSKRSRDIMHHLMESGESNCYTIQKNGIRKMIYQTPWRLDGSTAGLVEISMEIPWEMNHYNRDEIPFIPDAFLFDLDGVIIDSEGAYTTIWDTINQSFPTGIVDFATKIKGTTLSNILSTYFPDPNLQDNVEQMLYALEAKMDYQIFPGALNLLTRIKAAGIPCALVTSSNDVKMKHLWQQHPELKEYFNVTVTADMITRSKPDPEGYLKAAELLNVAPQKCVVIEDSVQGVLAGEAADSFVIGICGTHPADSLRPHAKVVVDDLAKIFWHS